MSKSSINDSLSFLIEQDGYKLTFSSILDDGKIESELTVTNGVNNLFSTEYNFDSKKSIGN